MRNKHVGQDTGCHGVDADGNGVELREGDIVTLLGRIAVIEWYPEWRRFVMKYLNGDLTGLNRRDYDSLTVHGDVRLNPEILQNASACNRRSEWDHFVRACSDNCELYESEVETPSSVA